VRGPVSWSRGEKAGLLCWAENSENSGDAPRLSKNLGFSRKWAGARFFFMNMTGEGKFEAPETLFSKMERSAGSSQDLVALDGKRWGRSNSGPQAKLGGK